MVPGACLRSAPGHRGHSTAAALRGLCQESGQEIAGGATGAPGVSQHLNIHPRSSDRPPSPLAFPVNMLLPRWERLSTLPAPPSRSNPHTALGAEPAGSEGHTEAQSPKGQSSSQRALPVNLEAKVATKLQGKPLPRHRRQSKRPEQGLGAPRWEVKARGGWPRAGLTGLRTLPGFYRAWPGRSWERLGAQEHSGLSCPPPDGLPRERTHKPTTRQPTPHEGACSWRSSP